MCRGQGWHVIEVLLQGGGFEPKCKKCSKNGNWKTWPANYRSLSASQTDGVWGQSPQPPDRGYGVWRLCTQLLSDLKKSYFDAI